MTKRPDKPGVSEAQPAAGRSSGAVADLDADFTRGETAMLLGFIFLMAMLAGVLVWLVIELTRNGTGG